MAKSQGWNGGRFLLVLVACFVVHFVTNIANDYFDYVQGTDSGNAIGGSRVIQQDKITLTPARLGNHPALFHRIHHFSLYRVRSQALRPGPAYSFAFLRSLFYVAPPFVMDIMALASFLLPSTWGPSWWWVPTGLLPANRVWMSFVSVPVGLMVASILYYQSLPDINTDEAAGKRTLAVRLGKQGACFVLILWLTVIYFTIIALVISGLLTWLSLLSLLTVPIFVKLIRIVRSTEDWILLDQYGKYVRMLYFFNGIAIILGVV